METTEQRLLREFNLPGSADVDNIVSQLRQRFNDMTNTNRQLVRRLQEAESILDRLSYEQKRQEGIIKVMV